MREQSILVPATVVVVRNGKEIMILFAQVNLVDKVLVRSGERIGVDS